MNATMQLLQTSPVGTSKKSQWEGRDVVFPYFSKDFDDFSRTIFGGKDFLYPEKEKTTSFPGVVFFPKKNLPKKKTCYLTLNFDPAVLSNTIAPCGARVHDIGTIAVTRQAEGLHNPNVLKKCQLETFGGKEIQPITPRIIYSKFGEKNTLCLRSHYCFLKEIYQSGHGFWSLVFTETRIDGTLKKSNLTSLTWAKMCKPFQLPSSHIHKNHLQTLHYIKCCIIFKNPNKCHWILQNL